MEKLKRGKRLNFVVVNWYVARFGTQALGINPITSQIRHPFLTF